MTRLSCALIVTALIAVGCSPKDSENKVAAGTDTTWPASKPGVEPAPTTSNPSTTGVEMVPPTKGSVTQTTPVDPNSVEVVKGAIKRMGRKPIEDITKVGADGWGQSKSDIMKLVETADTNIINLKNAKMTFQMHAELPEGKGEINLDTVVADNKRYLLRYARFEMEPQPHFETYIVTDRKGEEVTLVGQNYVPGRQSVDVDLLKGWERNSSHYLATTIGTTRKPLTELINAAKTAGWKVTGESKVFQQGLSFTRILLTSKDAEPTKYEIMVNNKEKLPVSFRAERRGSKKVSVFLNIGWAFKDVPVTAEELSPKAPVEKVNVLSPEEAAKFKMPQKPTF